MEKDFSEIYEARLKALRPWAWYFLVWFIIILALPVAMIVSDPDTRLIPPVVLALAVAIIPAVRPFLRVLTCPSCKKFMGRDIGSFCTMCGVRLRKDKR